MPRDPPGAAEQANQHPARRGLGRRGQRVPADEIPGLVELHHPAQARVERRDGRAEFVAIQRHARLQPEGVPCGQPGRHQAGLGPRRGQRGPDVLRVLRGGEQLETIFAGVPGPGQQDAAAGHRGRLAGVVPDPVQRDAGQWPEDARRGRPLDGDQRIAGRLVGDLRVVGGRPLGERGQHHPGVGRVRHHQELLVGQPVHDEVVQDAAVGRADHRVPGAAGRHRGQVTDQRVVQGGRRARAADADLAHVRQVEQASRGPHGPVFRGLAAVPQRHQPPGELGHRGAQAVMHAAQRRLPRLGGIRRGHRVHSRAGPG